MSVTAAPIHISSVQSQHIPDHAGSLAGRGACGGGCDNKKEQARLHPQKNVITRALGPEAEVRPDYFEFTLQPGGHPAAVLGRPFNMVTDLEMLEYAKEYPGSGAYLPGR